MDKKMKSLKMMRTKEKKKIVVIFKYIGTNTTIRTPEMEIWWRVWNDSQMEYQDEGDSANEVEDED